jgi:hypothetical protein
VGRTVKKKEERRGGGSGGARSIGTVKRRGLEEKQRRCGFGRAEIRR